MRRLTALALVHILFILASVQGQAMAAEKWANDDPSSDVSDAIATNPDIHLRVPETPYEDERKFDFLAEFDFFSKYVSKGLPCSDGPVWQPSLTFEYYNIGLSVWSNFVLNNEANQGQFNEIDILPYYNLKIGNFSFVPAVNFIFGLNKNPASLNYMIHDVIRPQFHASYTIGNFTPYLDANFYVYPTNRFGIYMDFGVNFGYEFNDIVEVDTSVQFAVGGKRWNASRTNDSSTQLNNFEYVLSLTFSVNKQFSIVPVMHVVVTLPEELRQRLAEPDFIWGGLMVKYDL